MARNCLNAAVEALSRLIGLRKERLQEASRRVLLFDEVSEEARVLIETPINLFDSSKTAAAHGERGLRVAPQRMVELALEKFPQGRHSASVS